MIEFCDYSWLLWAFCGDEVTASGDADAGFDVSNLINGSDRAWQATGAATVNITFAQPTTVDAIAIAGVEMTTGSTVTVSNGAAVLNSWTIEDCDHCSGASLFASIDSVSVTDLTFTFSDPAGGQIRACSILANEAVRFEVLDGWSVKVIDPSGTPRRSLAGTRKSSCGAKWRELELRLNMNDELRREFISQEMCKGSSLQLMVIITDEGQCDPSLFLSAPKNLSAFTRQSNFSRFSKPLSLEEIVCC